MWRKGFIGVFGLAKIGCLGLLAGLAYSSVTLCRKQGCSANKKGVGTHPKKLAILKQLRTNLKAKHEKGVGTPFPRVPAPLHPSTPLVISQMNTVELYLQTPKHSK